MIARFVSREGRFCSVSHLNQPRQFPARHRTTEAEEARRTGIILSGCNPAETGLLQPRRASLIRTETPAACAKGSRGFRCGPYTPKFALARRTKARELWAGHSPRQCPRVF